MKFWRQRALLGLLATIIAIPGVSSAAAGAVAQRAESPLPTVCFGFSGTSAYEIGLVLYPNGDLWEIHEYGQRSNDFYDDPALDTQARIMTNVQAVTEDYILQRDGTLWAFGAVHNGKREHIKLMDQVEQIVSRSLQKLILKKDGTLWFWGMTQFSGDEAGISMPVKLLDRVAFFRDEYVVNLCTGETYFLEESHGGLGDQGFTAKKLPEGYRKTVAYYGDSSGFIVTDKAIYSTALVHIADMTDVKQVDELGGTAYILKKNGDLWAYRPYDNMTLTKVLGNVEKICSDYFYHRDGTYSNWLREPIDTIITPEILETALFSEDKLLLAQDHRLYILGEQFPREIEKAALLAADVKKVVDGGEWLNIYFLLKTNGSLWLYIHKQEEVGIGRSTQAKVVDGLVDCVSQNDTMFAVKADGSVWGIKPNKTADPGTYADPLDQMLANLVAAYSPLNARLAVQYGSIPIYLDGKLMTFDAAPFIEEGRTLVPIRIIAEELGAEISWNKGEVTVMKDGVNIRLQMGSEIASLNGAEHMLDVGARLQEGRTFVPLRFLSEALSFGVTWEDETVFLTSAQGLSPSK